MFYIPAKITALLNAVTRKWIPIVVGSLGLLTLIFGIHNGYAALGTLFIGVAIGIWFERTDEKYTQEYHEYLLSINDEASND